MHVLSIFGGGRLDITLADISSYNNSMSCQLVIKNGGKSYRQLRIVEESLEEGNLDFSFEASQVFHSVSIWILSRYFKLNRLHVL